MNKYSFASFDNDAIHSFQHRVDEFMPQLWPHLQSTLLTPIVAEHDRINIIFQDLFDLSNVVLRDRVEQLVHEMRVVIEIHQQGLQAAHSPGPFVEGETDAKNTIPISKLFEFTGYFSINNWSQWI